MAKMRLRYRIEGEVEEVFVEVTDITDAIEKWREIWVEKPNSHLDVCELEEEKDGEWVIWQDEDGWSLEEWLVEVEMSKAVEFEEDE